MIKLSKIIDYLIDNQFVYILSQCGYEFKTKVDGERSWSQTGNPAPIFVYDISGLQRSSGSKGDP